MPLTENRNVDRYVDQELRSMLVKGGVHIYWGAIVVIERASGYAKPFVAGLDAGWNNHFAGIAYDEVNATNAADAELAVRIYTRGDFGFPITNGGILNLGAKVYACADDELTLDDNGSHNVYVGRAQDWLSGNELIVRLHGVLDADAR